MSLVSRAESWDFWQSNRLASIQSNLNLYESLKDGNLNEFLSERTSSPDLLKEVPSGFFSNNKGGQTQLRDAILRTIGEQKSKMELVLKSIIAVEQIDFIFNTITDNDQDTSLKQFMRNILV